MGVPSYVKPAEVQWASFCSLSLPLPHSKAELTLPLFPDVAESPAPGRADVLVNRPGQGIPWGQESHVVSLFPGGERVTLFM